MNVGLDSTKVDDDNRTPREVAVKQGHLKYVDMIDGYVTDYKDIPLIKEPDGAG
jgi:hypothetical protein